MFQSLADWLKRRRDRAELDMLDVGEHERVAHDLGVSGAELDFLVRESHDPVELPRMLAALGIDEAALRRAQPALMRDMQRVCSVCGSLGECRNELELGTAGTTYAGFCPNAAAFEALAAKAQPKH